MRRAAYNACNLAAIDHFLVLVLEKHLRYADIELEVIDFGKKKADGCFSVYAFHRAAEVSLDQLSDFDYTEHVLERHANRKILRHCALPRQIHSKVIKFVRLNLVAKFFVDLTLQAELARCKVNRQNLCLGILPEDVPHFVYLVEP